MPLVSPIAAIGFSAPPGGDVSSRIAPPYDVLDQAGKDRLLRGDPNNIVTIDLPHLPAKTVGPDNIYQNAGQAYRKWLADGVLVQRGKPAMFAYQQTYTANGRRFQRRGLIANVQIQPFGKSPSGKGGIHPHEQTFSGPKEDRMKLMRATRAQLSPIFGLHSDPPGKVHSLLSAVIDARPATLKGVTAHDGTLHEIWAIDDAAGIGGFSAALSDKDIFIADGHHRYTTALNYRQQLLEKGPLPADHAANHCLFVLIAMQDPGMIVLPTHRVFGGMANFTFDKFLAVAKGKLNVVPFKGDLATLEKVLPGSGQHAMGLYCPSNSGQALFIATTVEPDPLAKTHAKQSPAWRQLDVAIVQHVIVEQICEPHLCTPGNPVQWKFPHTLEEFQADTNAPGFQLGVMVQPTPLESVRLVSEAGELMPQKSTFFYPKLATGLVINPIS